MYKLDEFLKLSHYLKSYELYKAFSDVDTKNRDAIVRIEGDLRVKKDVSKKEREALKKYYELLEKIEVNNRLLEDSFNNYDFGDDTFRQSLVDYKVYAYEFVLDTMLSSVDGKEFRHRKDMINHINTASKLISRYFVEKFYLPDDFDKIMEKAFDKVLSIFMDDARSWGLVSSELGGVSDKKF